MPDGEVVIDWPDAREASQSDKLAMGEQAANIRYKIYQSGGVPESVIPDSYFHETLDIDVVDAEGIDDEPDNGPELND